MKGDTALSSSVARDLSDCEFHACCKSMIAYNTKKSLMDGVITGLVTRFVAHQDTDSPRHSPHTSTQQPLPLPTHPLVAQSHF